MDDTKTQQDTLMPQQTRDNPYDVTLVVEDGKEFKAHKRILSEASPLFEKLLNSDMRESQEGVIRLEMLTEAGLGAVLEFIYTGGVQISAEDQARDLIEMADYLFIPALKTLAGRFLTSTLNTWNCISTHRFAERYLCEELISDAKNFIHANFTSVAKTIDFLNISCEEVNKWISSDEIAISSEEDVFKIILTWIYHNEIERKKYFADLFRQVRLVYVPRNYLFNDVVTNDLVTDKCCRELVNRAMKAIYSKNSENISIPPSRKSLETSVIAVCIHNELLPILCYVPSTDEWYALREPAVYKHNMVSCHGTLCSIFCHTGETQKILRLYDSFFDRRREIPYDRKRDLQQIFVSDNSKDDIFVLETDNEISCPDCVSLHSPNEPEGVSQRVSCGKNHLYIIKYKPESESWEELNISFDFGLRGKSRIVLKGDFIYFIGGIAKGMEKDSNNVDRYNLKTQKWENLANLREARHEALGTATSDSIFIYGGCGCRRAAGSFKTWEVYSERTNKWQIIASPELRLPPTKSSIMCVDDKVYVMGNVWVSTNRIASHRGEIACYDPDNDKWDVITKLSPNIRWYDIFEVRSCSMRVFAGTIFQWTQLTEMSVFKFDEEKSMYTVTSNVNGGQGIN